MPAPRGIAGANARYGAGAQRVRVKFGRVERDRVIGTGFIPRLEEGFGAGDKGNQDGDELSEDDYQPDVEFI